MQCITDPHLKEMGPPQTFPNPLSHWALQGLVTDRPSLAEVHSYITSCIQLKAAASVPFCRQRA